MGDASPAHIDNVQNILKFHIHNWNTAAIKKGAKDYHIFNWKQNNLWRKCFRENPKKK